MLRICLLTLLLALGLGCRSPLMDLVPAKGGPQLALTVTVKNNSRKLSHLWTPTGELDSPTTRQAALERHRLNFETDLRAEAAARSLQLNPSADLQLRLTITSLGEVRAKYIAWGIASGVAWGVGTGLLVHNTRLAVGLGAYELLEESAFWIGGSLLMSRWSSPAVVEARLFKEGSGKPLWEETYYVLWARQELATYLPEAQRRRECQLQASLRKVQRKLFHDLEAIPDFPRALRPLQSAKAPEPAASAAPAPRRQG